MQQPAVQKEAAKDVASEAIGMVPTGFATHGPKTVPRVDYERIFVLDSNNNLLGEYALDDDCPLESSDLRRSLPLSGLRHLISFYQGEYAFTPFRVDDVWFVVLTRGVPRIEDRGSIGTLLAAARIHIPPMIEPLLARREAELRTREQEVSERERGVANREQRASTVEAQIRLASTQLSEREAELRSREAGVRTLREYAARMQRTFVPSGPPQGEGASGARPEARPPPSGSPE